MPPLVNTLELSEFFHGTPPFINRLPGGDIVSALSPFGASIQKSWRYRVTFVPDVFRNKDINRVNLYKRVGKMPIIRAWQCESVTVPNYSFERVCQHYGPVPRSFPQLSYDGFDVRIKMVEDSNCTVANFINWMQRSIIDKETGNYAPPSAITIPLIAVLCEDDMGIPSGLFNLHNAYYLTASAAEFDYSANEKVTYDVTFGVDIINTFFPKAYAFQQFTNLLF
jgi:hypothetical protein